MSESKSASTLFAEALDLLQQYRDRRWELDSLLLEERRTESSAARRPGPGPGPTSPMSLASALREVADGYEERWKSLRRIAPRLVSNLPDPSDLRIYPILPSWWRRFFLGPVF